MFMVMRQILLGILLVTVTFSSPVAADGTARCSTIKDHDERMKCFALVTHNSSYCGFIRNSDSRAWCHALLGK